MVMGNEVTCCSTEVSLSCFSVALHKSSPVFSVRSQVCSPQRATVRKGKAQLKYQAVSTTAGVQDRMTTKLVTPTSPAQVQKSQKYFYWEHLRLRCSLRFKGTEHKVKLCTLNLPVPVSRGSCSLLQVDSISSPCCGSPASDKGLRALLSLQSSCGYLKPMSKHSPNPSGTAAFFHICKSETSTEPH